VTEDDREKGARALLRRVKQDFSQLFSKEYNRRFFRTHMEVLDVDYLVALAREGDKDALEILRKHAHGARRAGMCVPASLHEFVWEIFIDGPPKAKSGTSPKDTDLKYQTFRVLAKILNKDTGSRRIAALSIAARNPALCRVACLSRRSSASTSAGWKK
jgi:hypothetical protein